MPTPDQGSEPATDGAEADEEMPGCEGEEGEEEEDKEEDPPVEVETSDPVNPEVP